MGASFADHRAQCLRTFLPRHGYYAVFTRGTAPAGNVEQFLLRKQGGVIEQVGQTDGLEEAFVLDGIEDLVIGTLACLDNADAQQVLAGPVMHAGPHVAHPPHPHR